MKKIHVAVGVICNSQRQILIAKRADHLHQGGLWEFPGGKLEEGEQPEQALARELKEELGIDVEPSDMAPITFLSHAYPEYDFHLMMPTWLIKQWQGEPINQPGEHQAVKWVHPNDMKHMLILEADWPLVERLMEITKNPA